MKGRLIVDSGPLKMGDVPGSKQNWHTGVCSAEVIPTWDLCFWLTGGSAKWINSALHNHLRYPCKGDCDKNTVTGL